MATSGIIEPISIDMPKSGAVPTKDEDALQYAVECKDFGLQFRQQYESEWIDYYKAYKQELPEEDVVPGRAQLFIPYIFSVIESMLPELLLTIFNEKDIVKFMATDPRRADAASLAQRMFSLLLGRINLFCNVEEALRIAMLFGDGPAKIPWVRRANSNGKVERLPGFVSLLPWDFIKDPTSSDIQKGHFAGMRQEKTRRELVAMQRLGNYKNVEELMDRPPLDYRSNPGERELLNVDGKGIAGSNPQDKWEVWEMWIDDRLIVFGDDSVLLRNSRNPFNHGLKPFINFVAFPDVKSPYNMGIPKILDNLQREANSYRNARLDNVLMSMMGMFKLERSAHINPSDLILKPGGIIRTDDNDGLVKMEMGGVPNTAFMEQEAFDRDIQRTSGMYEHYQGASPRREETATGIISLQQAAGRRLMLMLMRIQKGPLPEFAQMAVSMMQQFSEDEIVIPYMTEDEQIAYEYFTNDEIQGDFMYEYTARPEDLSVDAQRNNSVALWNMFSQVPFMNPVKLAADTLKSFGKGNVRDYINSQYHQLLGVQRQMLQNPNHPLTQQMAAGLGPNGMGLPGGTPQLMPGQESVPGPGGMPANVPPEVMQMIVQLLGAGGVQ